MEEIKLREVKPRKESLIIVIIYGVLGSLWILLTDNLLTFLTDNLSLYKFMQTFKGWLYVLVNMVLIYVLIFKRLHLYKKTHDCLNEHIKKQYYNYYYDQLTHLPNRHFIKKEIDQLIKSNEPFWLLCFDIDNIKHINDTLGHSAGDRLIQVLSEFLNEIIHKPHIASRYSGDEFLVVLKGPISKELLIDSIIATYEDKEKSWVYQNQEFFVTMSIGIANYPENGHTFEDLFKNADTAMYYVKENGKNNFAFYDESMNQKNNLFIKTTNKLVKAITNDEFVVYYQPLMHLKNENIVGVEALVRWIHEGKLIYPGDFIGIAEKTGLISDIDQLVLKKVCQTIKNWNHLKLKDIIFSINISSVSFRNKNLIKNIKRLISEYNIKPQRIQFEITETSVMEDLDSTCSILSELQEIGFRLALDDFGTGFSSLTYLRKLPIDVVKIDQTFIQNFVGREDNQLIMKSIIQLSHGLNKLVTVEGIETKEQLLLLQDNQCDIGQGYLFSKPVTADEIKKILKNQKVQ